MSCFTESRSNFLTERRNNILEEVCRGKSYSDLKKECFALPERLQATAGPELQSVIIDYLDDFTIISSFETKYYYLCGLRNGNKSDRELS